MTDFKYSILKKLYKADGRRFNKNMLIEKIGKKHNQRTNARHAIEEFITQGIIKNCNDLDIALTRKGEDAYEDAYDQRKRDRRSFVIALISVIAASAAALVPFIEFILSRFSGN